jgi:hypothetical protein
MGPSAPMSLAYRLMYLVGFTPWDRDEVSEELSTLGEAAGVDVDWRKARRGSARAAGPRAGR